MSEATGPAPRKRFVPRRWMRMIFVLLLLVLLGPYAASRFLSSSRQISLVQLSEVEAGVASNDPVRVACYNIAHGRGLATSNWQGGSPQERTDRLDEIAELLRTIDAEVLVLNEVDFDCSWSHGVDQATYLAARSGYRYVGKCRSIDAQILHWTWRHGIAVLSKSPISAATAVDYPAYSKTESLLIGKKRGLVCQIERNGRAIRVAAVHLSHRDESIRRRSAAMLDKLAQNEAAPALILAGDFNSTPSGFPGFTADSRGKNAIEAIDAGKRFRRFPSGTPNESDLTFSSDNPVRVIDWIMIPSQWEFEHYTVPPSTLSDHRPVVADVTIIDAPPE